ncbi:MAG: NAD-dependent epimerase/dehydratase family protein [Planctomycetes bacterium]|nr:NAD-dependent epimerase/dehydratase family protein [Planctomycetota bacterium]
MFRTEAELEDALSEPTPQVIETLARHPGDIVFLGAAGKMGPTLARMAKRAAPERRVMAVSRFSTGGEAAFTSHGIEAIRCDLLNESEVAKLPDAPNVVYMPGRKFGSTGDEGTTWAINCYLPSLVCRKYARSRIVAFSTGNVYPFSRSETGGPTEDDLPNPVGEYGMSALGRERMFGYFSRSLNVPVSILRLNYAVDLRYGVLVDLARSVLAGDAVNLGMGYFNTIWQGDANAMTLRAFDHCEVPPRVLNMTGPEVLSVRRVCERFGELFGVAPRFTGTEGDTALISNATAGIATLGPLQVRTDRLIEWVADWVKDGGRLLGKPTHFEARDGKY